MTKTLEKPATPLKYFGGKSYLVDDVLRLMPEHTTYLEPFAGGLQVLFAKEPDRAEVVSDTDYSIHNFWSVLGGGGEARERFLDRARFTGYGESFFEQSLAVLASPPSANPDHEERALRAWAVLVKFRQSRGGMGQDYSPSSAKRLRRLMGDNVSAWDGGVAGLRACCERLGRVETRNDDAVKLLTQDNYNRPEVWAYLDPPYRHASRTSKDVYGKEMTDAQHGDLLAVLVKSKAKILVSSYPDPMYEEALAGWGRVEVEKPNNAAGGQTKQRMIEVLWRNYE